MGTESGFLLPAPGFEPPLPSVRRPGGGAPGCRARVDSKSAARAAGPVGLQRVVRSSHPVKSGRSDERNTGAGQFARTALRSALEVLDGRRPAAQLAPLAEPAVVAAVRTLAGERGLPGRELGAATLTRVDVIMSGTGGGEVCAAYDRGGRHFALAARIVRGRSGWRLAAFRVC